MRTNKSLTGRGYRATMWALCLTFSLLGLPMVGVALMVFFLSGEAFYREELWIVSLVFGLVGSIFLVCGLCIWWLGTRKNPLARLRDTGEPVRGEIIDVERNFMIRVNRFYPYRLVCKYELDGQTYLCRSENIWYNPSTLLRDRWVTIYLDPKNSRKYYVDLSEVLEPVVEQ